MGQLKKLLKQPEVKIAFTGGGFNVSGLLTTGGTVFSFKSGDRKGGAIFGSA